MTEPRYAPILVREEHRSKVERYAAWLEAERDEEHHR
jgi:hypothetical protein